MMRSMYSGVSGLKVHQTKMDVIGNNIANVNTVGFKSSNVNFSDVLYQTTQNASGANAASGITGKNAKQIGLGTQVASITTTVSSTGGSQRTDNALDCMITGDAFFVVNRGGANYFTKAGSFNVDATGTLCTPAGASVMGWGVNAEGTDIVRNTVQPLTVMSAENMTSAPEGTKNTYITGNIDTSDTQLAEEDGVTTQVSFYDKLGNSYNLKLALKQVTAENGDGTSSIVDGKYTVEVTDIVDSNGESIFWTTETSAAGKTTKKLTPLGNQTFTFGGVTYKPELKEETVDGVTTTKFQLTPEAANDLSTLNFNPNTGKFDTVLDAGETIQDEPESDDEYQVLKLLLGTTGTAGGTGTTGATETTSPFEVVKVDFTTITQFAGNGKCNLQSQRGTVDGSGEGAGRKMGAMTGLSIEESGKIYGSYDNGTTKLLGQIAVATFANPSGLEAIGDSMFATTQNSGDFNGIGTSITDEGGSIATGVLEMSNVDLSAEFTNMITTQRGFQANSRIITTSDTLLEELINLKR